MRILDVLLQAGFHDVRFEGALSPLAGGAMR